MNAEERAYTTKASDKQDLDAVQKVKRNTSRQELHQCNLARFPETQRTYNDLQESPSVRKGDKSGRNTRWGAGHHGIKKR